MAGAAAAAAAQDADDADDDEEEDEDDDGDDVYLRKDMRSLGALCSRVRCAAKSSVT